LGVNTYLRNELWKDPIKFYEHNIAKAPRNFRPYHNLGVEYGMRKDYPKALDHFNKALALKTNAPIIYAGIAQAYFGLNEFQAAIPYYLKTLEMGFTFADLYGNISLCYLRTNKYDEAILFAGEGLRRYPENLAMMARVGSIYYFIVQELGNKGQDLLKKYELDENRAFSLLETAYALGNREKDVVVNLPPAYIKSAQNEPAGEKQAAWLQKAEKIATEGYRASPEDADLRNNLIGIYLVKGQWREALKLPGLSKDDLNKLSVHLLNQRLFQEAQEVLKKLQAQYGSDQVIEFNQAICSYYLGHEDEAVKTFQRIMATTSAPVTKYQANHFITEWQNKHARK
jgi:tetratricopeptide (TPR) repeat protein